MPFVPSPLIYAKRIPGKGLGVFARVDLVRDQEIERAAMLVLPVAEARALAAHGGVLDRYAFAWGRGTVALALGFGSLYNHAYDPNAYCEDRGPRTKVFFARRPIRAHEEITINYHGEPGSRADVGFTVLDSTEPDPPR